MQTFADLRKEMLSVEDLERLHQEAKNKEKEVREC